MNDMLAALIDAAYTKRANDGTLPRRPEENTPWQPERSRTGRRTQRPYRDPTGETATGNVKRESKR